MDRAPHPAAANARAGMSIIELIMTLAVAAIVVVVALPRLQPALARRDVDSARRAVAAIAAQARASAVTNRRTVTINVQDDRIWLTAAPRRGPVCGGCTVDTVGAVRDFDDEYGATVQASAAAYQVDGRGLAPNPAATLVIIVQKGVAADTVSVNGFGRIQS